MKERPILFSEPMVRAILAGRKTVTRRVKSGERCPYGIPGDRLWVREAFATAIPGCPNGICYRADHNDRKGDGPSNPIRWRPSIHMPRWASRILLEVVDARPERLWGITGEDAMREGLDKRTCAKVFEAAAHGCDLEYRCWIANDRTGEDVGESVVFCRTCAEKRIRKTRNRDDLMPYGDRGCVMEEDGARYCEDCGQELRVSLTRHGIKTLIRELEGNLGKTYCALSDGDFAYLFDLCDGIGDYSEEDLPGLAHIAFAALWDSINARRGYPWIDNPWVWRIEFKVLDKDGKQ